MNNLISKEEWQDITSSLEEHNAIFSQIWKLGKPIFVDNLETAAVYFDKQGNCISFLFNKEFWKEVSFYDKLFVICHECLHVILNHGVRIRDSKNNLISNKCLDIVVNHLLVNGFGFERSKLTNWKEWCWVETVFPDHQVENNQSYEYYFQFFKDIYGDGHPNSVTSLVDDHSGLDFDPSSLLKDCSKNLSFAEKNFLSDSLDRCFEKGEDSSSLEEILIVSTNKKNKKWDKLILNKCNSKIDQIESEQWARQHRRLVSLNTRLFLPSDLEIEERGNDKVNVCFFMDTSGSCWALKDRFFNAANSLSNKFSINIFCFDSCVYEVEEKKVFGGGGTSFSILESHVAKFPKYPDAVFVLTDGYGDLVTPKHPKRWHWFLTKHNARHCVPKDSFIYNLEDFE